MPDDWKDILPPAFLPAAYPAPLLVVPQEVHIKMGEPEKIYGIKLLVWKTKEIEK